MYEKRRGSRVFLRRIIVIIITIITIIMLAILLFLLPSDNVQHDLQHRSLLTFPKEENLGNKKETLLIYELVFRKERTIFCEGQGY